MHRLRITVIALAVVSLFPVFAAGADHDDSGLEAWGVRLGVGNDPDQIIVGVQFDLGQIVDRVRFEPNVELGFGDDHTILSASAPVHYLFDVDAKVQPFAGGGVSVAYIDHDHGGDEDTEIALKLIGGVDWRLRNDRGFRLEFDLHLGDVYDAQVMAAWSF